MTKNIGERLTYSLNCTNVNSLRFQDLQERSGELVDVYTREISTLEQALENPSLKGKTKARRKVQVERLKTRLATVDTARTREQLKRSDTLYRGRSY